MIFVSQKCFLNIYFTYTYFHTSLFQVSQCNKLNLIRQSMSMLKKLQSKTARG